ncbi:MAG TPA: ATP-binding protein, partial [Methanobacteriaceae archaeon]|nr:ATP-binding protein [Methanobacteriaceae archaeon]
MSYYHDYRMEKIFQALEQPKTIESLQLSESFITDLFLKIVAGYGTIKTSTINEITGIHWDILEKILPELEKSGLCATVGGGFLFSSVEYSITPKGRE